MNPFMHVSIITMKFKFKFKSKRLEQIQANWFPEDPISLRNVLRDTFWLETSKPIVRLVVAIFISALLLVLVKNAYHQAFMRLQALKVEQSQLHTEWMQLLIEEGTWGGYDRVNQIATNNLGMGPPAAQNTQILVVPDGPSDSLQRLVSNSALTKTFFDANGYLPAVSHS